MNRLIFYFVTCVFQFPILVLAQKPIYVHGEQLKSELPLDHFVYVQVDFRSKCFNTKSFDVNKTSIKLEGILSDIKTNPANYFESKDSISPQNQICGYENFESVVSLSIKNVANTDFKGFLYFGSFDKLELVGEESLGCGFLSDCDKRICKDHYYYYPINILSNSSKELRFKLSNKAFLGRILFRPKLVPEKVFYKQLTSRLKKNLLGEILNAALLVSTFLMSCISAIRYFINKEKNYLYYLFYTLTLTLYALKSLEANPNYNFILSNYPFLFRYIEPFVNISPFLAYFFFASHFLQLEKYVPTTYRANKFAIFIFFGAMLLETTLIYWNALVESRAVFVINRITIYSYCFYLLYIFFLNWNKFSKAASYIIWGSAFVMACSILTFSQAIRVHYGIIERQDSWPLQLPLQIGVAVELLMFYAAIAHQFRIDKNEKERLKRNEINHLLELSNLKKEISESKLLALKKQIKPHFLSNCVLSIQNMIQNGKTKEVHAYIGTLQKLLLDTLHLSQRTEITLKKELELCKNYLELEKSSFSNLFHYSIDFPEGYNLDDWTIPPFLLQPFLENAIIHGLKAKNVLYGKEKKISVSFAHFNKKYIQCVIKDNGIGYDEAIKKQRNKKSTGLNSLRNRIELFNKQNDRNIQIEKIETLYDENNTATGTAISLLIDNQFD